MRVSLNYYPTNNEIKYGDSANLDASSRLRTSAQYGIFDNKNISDRNRNLFSEIISGVIITYSSLSGTFTVGEEVRGALPAGYIALGTISTDNGTDTMNITCDHNDFQVGDTITGQTSGATATVVSTNTGSDIQFDYNTSSVTLTTGTGATDYAIRQTQRYNAYVPGKSQLVVSSFILGSSVENVIKRAGLFDDLNGLFLEQNGNTDVAIVTRTSTSGSLVDTRITQDNWNLDKLDGTGESGIILDLTKAQILIIDFQWLGAGRIRYGFDIDGVIIYIHEVKNSNNLNVVYMKTPTLPIRYEIRNSASTISQNSISEICCSLSSEGGYALLGQEFSQSNGITSRTVTTTLTPVFAIRLKNNFPTGHPNRKTVRFLNFSCMANSNDAHIELHHVQDPIDITATWTDVNAGSVVEYSTDISAVTGRPNYIIEHMYVPTSTGGKSSADMLTGEFINLHSFISQNYNSDNSQLFVIYAQSVSGNADIYTNISWIEFD